MRLPNAPIRGLASATRLVTIQHRGYKTWVCRLGTALAAAIKIVGFAGVLVPIVGGRALRPRATA